MGRYSVGSIPVFSSSDIGFIVPFMFDKKAQSALQFDQSASTMYSNLISFVDGMRTFPGISFSYPLNELVMLDCINCGMLNAVRCKFKFLNFFPKTSSIGMNAYHLFSFAQLTSMLKIYGRCDDRVSCTLLLSKTEECGMFEKSGAVADCPSAMICDVFQYFVFIYFNIHSNIYAI